MKIAVLTSSRADFGIYLPLLKKMQSDAGIELDIIVFGTHLSYFHGYTLHAIEEAGFKPFACIDTLMNGDTPDAIATSTGITIIKFSDLWKRRQGKYDHVICLGDRYEMFAAVFAGVPFNIKFAHLHAGEVTEGAIDNIYRHAITHASALCFTSTLTSFHRVTALTEKPGTVFNVGALSLDSLKDFIPYTIAEFALKWYIDLSLPTVLFTFHSETMEFAMNGVFMDEIIGALRKMEGYQFLITMPNSDTSGNLVRKRLLEAFSESRNFFLVESLGLRGYFTALENCSFVMGNSSSGIIEAASFNKYVLDLGDRQKGRDAGTNVLHAKISEEDILQKVGQIESRPAYCEGNIYWNGGAADKIMKILKSQHA